jgi:hypothetical protein
MSTIERNLLTKIWTATEMAKCSQPIDYLEEYSTILLEESEI